MFVSHKLSQSTVPDWGSNRKGTNRQKQRCISLLWSLRTLTAISRPVSTHAHTAWENWQSPSSDMGTLKPLFLESHFLANGCKPPLHVAQLGMKCTSIFPLNPKRIGTALRSTIDCHCSAYSNGSHFECKPASRRTVVNLERFSFLLLFQWIRCGWKKNLLVMADKSINADTCPRNFILVAATSKNVMFYV